MSKEAFKDFVKKNPSLVKHVNDNSMSWQKFYEMYDMYGEDANIWKDYLTVSTAIVPEVVAANRGVGDFVNYFKNVNMDSVQESINGLQRVLGVIGDLATKSDNSVSSIIEKPIYKHMDD